METGTVLWFNVAKGYGFLSDGSGRNIFVHYSDIVMDGYKKLEEGQTVTFDIVESPKGPAARNVQAVLTPESV